MLAWTWQCCCCPGRAAGGASDARRTVNHRYCLWKCLDCCPCCCCGRWGHFPHCWPVEIDEILGEAVAAVRMSCTAGNTGDVAAEIDSTADTVAEDRNCWPPVVAVGNYSACRIPAFPRDWRIGVVAVDRQWLGAADVAFVGVAAAGAD